MNEETESLFKDLKSSNVERQMEAALALAFLLERALWPERYDSTHQLVLPEELLRLRLEDSAALENALARTCNALKMPTISLGAKITLSTVLGRTGRATCVKAILELLESECESLTDEAASGLILSIVPSISFTYPRDLLRSSIDEHHTVTVLEKLADRRSERLNDPLTRLQSCISKLSKPEE